MSVSELVNLWILCEIDLVIKIKAKMILLSDCCVKLLRLIDCSSPNMHGKQLEQLHNDNPKLVFRMTKACVLIFIVMVHMQD